MTDAADNQSAGGRASTRGFTSRHSRALRIEGSARAGGGGRQVVMGEAVGAVRAQGAREGEAPSAGYKHDDRDLVSPRAGPSSQQVCGRKRTGPRPRHRPSASPIRRRRLRRPSSASAFGVVRRSSASAFGIGLRRRSSASAFGVRVGHRRRLSGPTTSRSSSALKRSATRPSASVLHAREERCRRLRFSLRGCYGAFDVRRSKGLRRYDVRRPRAAR